MQEEINKFRKMRKINKLENQDDELIPNAVEVDLNLIKNHVKEITDQLEG